MNKKFLAVMVVLWAIALLSGCGKEVCTTTIVPIEPKTFGTLEAISCGDGNVILKVTPHYLPGGQVVTHLTVDCGKVVQNCGVGK